jgi:hypothetical protein
MALTPKKSVPEPVEEVSTTVLDDLDTLGNEMDEHRKVIQEHTLALGVCQTQFDELIKDCGGTLQRVLDRISSHTKGSAKKSKVAVVGVPNQMVLDKLTEQLGDDTHITVVQKDLMQLADDCECKYEDAEATLESCFIKDRVIGHKGGRTQTYKLKPE